MKTLLAAASLLLLTSAARAELPCELTDDDYASLAQSASQLTPDAIQALPAAKQQLLCQTRQFRKLVDDSDGVIQKPQKYSPYYLNPAEKTRVSRAVDAAIQRRIAGAGVSVTV